MNSSPNHKTALPFLGADIVLFQFYHIRETWALVYVFQELLNCLFFALNLTRHLYSSINDVQEKKNENHRGTGQSELWLLPQ
jgi:hypothetical protein